MINGILKKFINNKVQEKLKKSREVDVDKDEGGHSQIDRNLAKYVQKSWNKDKSEIELQDNAAAKR